MSAALFAIKSFVGFILLYFLVILSSVKGVPVEEIQITLEQLVQGSSIALVLTVIFTFTVARLRGFKPRSDLIKHLDSL